MSRPELVAEGEAVMSGTIGNCQKCGQHGYIMPLHGEKGGPMFCPPCSGAWFGEHGKKLKWRRVLIRAMKAYEAAGGKLWRDLDEMRLAASGFVSSGYNDAAPDADLTLEILLE